MEFLNWGGIFVGGSIVIPSWGSVGEMKAMHLGGCQNYGPVLGSLNIRSVL